MHFLKVFKIENIKILLKKIMLSLISTLLFYFHHTNWFVMYPVQGKLKCL